MDILVQIREIAELVFSQGDVKFLLGFVLFNVVVAIAAGIRKKKFDPHKLGEFLYRKLAPFVLVYGFLRVLGGDLSMDMFGVNLEMSWLISALWLSIAVTLSANLAENLIALGVPMPEQFKKFVSKEPELAD